MANPQYRMLGSGQTGLGYVRSLNRTFREPNTMFAPQTREEFIACETLVRQHLAVRIVDEEQIIVKEEPKVIENIIVQESEEEDMDALLQAKKQQVLDYLNGMNNLKLRSLAKHTYGLTIELRTTKEELINQIMEKIQNG